jgi:hypothetical protein
MSALRLATLSAMPLTILLGAVALPQTPGRQSSPMPIITDTPQYCLQLLDRIGQLIHARPQPPQDVANLSQEGQRMCDEGQTRGGIMRLRRALLLLQDSDK